MTDPITAAEQRGKIAGLEEAAELVASWYPDQDGDTGGGKFDGILLKCAPMIFGLAAAIRALAEKERGS